MSFLSLLSLRKSVHCHVVATKFYKTKIPSLVSPLLLTLTCISFTISNVSRPGANSSQQQVSQRFSVYYYYYSPCLLFSSRQFHKSHTDVNSWPLPNMAGNERHVFSSEKWKLVKKTIVWCSFSWQQTDPTAMSFV